MLESPYLNSREAAIYLRFVDATGAPQMKAFYEFRARHHIRRIRRGRSLLFKRVDLDRVLEEEPVLALARKRA